jgi:hypothetical protein
MLAAYLAVGEYDRTSRLINRKHNLINDKNLFNAIKQLSKYPQYHEAIAEPAYRLLTKPWYDRALMEIVIKHYKGVQSDWQSLSNMLSSISISNEELDSLILEKAVYMHQMNDDSQRVFIRAVGRLSDGQIAEDSAEYAFMYFCIYEMILNAFNPLFETIRVLEKLYSTNKEPFLAYALSHVYLISGLTTEASSSILLDACAEQELGDILFPIFKMHQDKFQGNAYIEKKQPFIYKTLPGKDVFLYYKVKGGEYRKLRMRYLRFGLYVCSLSVFYGEVIQFYYSEEMTSGSITTSEEEAKGSGVLVRGESDDPFYIINNAVVFEQMFQYNRAEEILSEHLKKSKNYHAKLLN